MASKREVIYTIGGRKAKNQMLYDYLVVRADGKWSEDTACYTIGFGVDDKGRRYMVLAEKVYGRGEWHGAYKSCGHWHGSGRSTFVKFWNVYKRKNFATAAEANRYWQIVNRNMVQWRVGEDHKVFTEEQFDILFA